MSRTAWGRKKKKENQTSSLSPVINVFSDLKRNCDCVCGSLSLSAELRQ